MSADVFEKLANGTLKEGLLTPKERSNERLSEVAQVSQR